MSVFSFLRPFIRGSHPLACGPGAARGPLLSGLWAPPGLGKF